MELISTDISTLQAVQRTRSIDAVVAVLPGGEVVSQYREMFNRDPNLRLLAVLEDEHGDAGLFELQPRNVRLGSLSPAGVAEAIRRAAQT